MKKFRTSSPNACRDTSSMQQRREFGTVFAMRLKAGWADEAGISLLRKGENVTKQRPRSNLTCDLLAG